jgi:hypothetical protein
MMKEDPNESWRDRCQWICLVFLFQKISVFIIPFTFIVEPRDHFRVTV